MIKLNCIDGLDYENVIFRKHLIDHISLELIVLVRFIEGVYRGDELGYPMYMIRYFYIDNSNSFCSEQGKYMVNVNGDLHKYINEWVIVYNRDNKLNELLDEK